MEAGEGQYKITKGTPGKKPRVAVKRQNPLEGTLAILVQSMRGQKVVIEMKNDVEISGILEETDRSMKWVAHLDSSLRPFDLGGRSIHQCGGGCSIYVHLRPLTHGDRVIGSVRRMDVALVQGKMVRYVHIPDEVDAIGNMKNYMRAMAKGAASYRRNMHKSKAKPA